MSINVTYQPDGLHGTPSAQFIDDPAISQPFVSVRLDRPNGDVSILTQRPDYLIALANQALEGVDLLGSRGGQTLTDEQRAALTDTHVRVLELLHPGAAMAAMYVDAAAPETD